MFLVPAAEAKGDLYSVLSKVEWFLTDTAAAAAGRTMAVETIAREAATRREFIVV